MSEQPNPTPADALPPAAAAETAPTDAVAADTTPDADAVTALADAPAFQAALHEHLNNLNWTWSRDGKPNGVFAFEGKPNLPGAALGTIKAILVIVTKELKPGEETHKPALELLCTRLGVPPRNDPAEQVAAFDELQRKLRDAEKKARDEHHKDCPPHIWDPMHEIAAARERGDALGVLRQLRLLDKRMSGGADVPNAHVVNMELYGDDVRGGVAKTMRFASDYLLRLAESADAGELLASGPLPVIRDRQWLQMTILALMKDIGPDVAALLDAEEQAAQAAADEKRKKVSAALVKQKPKDED